MFKDSEGNILRSFKRVNAAGALISIGNAERYRYHCDRRHLGRHLHRNCMSATPATPTLRAVFVDANPTLGDVAQKLLRPGDVPFTINRQPDIRSEALPAHAGGGRDRGHRPHAVSHRDRARMRGPEARRLPWHRRAQLHESGGAGRARHRGAHDQGLWRHGGRRVCGGADVDRRARLRADGPRNARRELGAHRRASAHRPHDRIGRLRRDRRGGGATRVGHGHEGAGLEPQPEDVSGRAVRRARSAARRERRAVAPPAVE